MYLHVRWILSSGCKLLSLDYSRQCGVCVGTSRPVIILIWDSHLRFSQMSIPSVLKFSPTLSDAKPECIFLPATTLFDPPGCIFEALSALFDSDHDFQLYAVLSSDSKEAGMGMQGFGRRSVMGFLSRPLDTQGGSKRSGLRTQRQWGVTQKSSTTWKESRRTGVWRNHPRLFAFFRFFFSVCWSGFFWSPLKRFPPHTRGR